MRLQRVGWLLYVACLVACQAPDGGSSTDAGRDVAEDVADDAADLSDLDAGADAGDVADGGDVVDAGDASDAVEVVDGDVGDVSDVDAWTFPLDGFGAISGTCHVLDDELTASEPSYFENAIDFGNDPYDPEDKPLLTTGGNEIIDDGNAGGSSLYSEVFAFEVLYRCELADLLKTETEISYVDPQGTITDLLVEVDGQKIGVSVTRAVAFPFEDPYTVQQATDLLTDKLQDVQSSTQNVDSSDAWVKQILHVIAYAPGHEDSVETAYNQLSADLKADTIVWVTVSNGDDQFLY